MQQIQELKYENRELKALIQYGGSAKKNTLNQEDASRLQSHLSLKSLKSIDVSQTQGVKTKATESVRSLNHSAISNRLGSNTPQNRSSVNRSFCNDPSKSEHILYHKAAPSS